MLRTSRLRLFLLSSLACLLLAGASHAQSTFGSIRGIATDGSGAVIADTSITLHSVEENTDRSFTCDNSGSFHFENLKPGHYTLRASHSGFSDADLKGIELIARQDLRLPITLSVAANATTVEVTSAADQINTEDATLSDSKNNQLITQLPLNNRATTTSPLGALSLSANVQQDSAGYIALGGASSSMVNFSVDGISTANVRQNGALQDAYPSQEGIAAVKVTAANNSAEFSQVGDVTFTTKSGSNNVHGSLFEYLQNDALDASPYGFNGKAPKKFNTFGGSLSGPISIPHLYNGKNRSFFFFDYEGNRRSTAVAQQFLVPTAADRSGNLADLCGGTIGPRRCSPSTRCPTSPARLWPAEPTSTTTTRTSRRHLRAPTAPTPAWTRPSTPSSPCTRASAARTSPPTTPTRCCPTMWTPSTTAACWSRTPSPSRRASSMSSATA
jgi:hypothetical protein